MAVVEGMFLFEVVVESIQSFIQNKQFVIKSDFADIFSLELRDPKHLNIVMPEPPPLPPEPPGKKGKKKPAAKKGKKGKGKNVVEAPPPGPIIQSGQSVLFACSAEFLIQSMRKSPLELSVWDREESLVYVGSSFIPWDEVYLVYLTNVANYGDPRPVTVKDEYNVFEEDKAKLVARLGIQIKLTFLKDKIITAFRTLSEDPNTRKYLYTGLNSKTTSYICTMKTSDETFIENSNKIENNFVIDKPKPKTGPINYADYKNAPGANLTFFKDGDYCCMKNADKPPDSIYKSPETLPEIDDIIDYVRKIIVSCNDNMRMLTPRPTIKPRIKATDIDRLCYCAQTGWPDNKLAERMKNEVQSNPCPICINAGKTREGSRGASFDIAKIRGPCGRPDCRIARDLRKYIEKLVEEDNAEIKVDEIIGPCGSKSCDLAEKIQEFIRHEGAFSKSANVEGLSTQCGCIDKMYKALTEKKTECDSICSKDCLSASDSSDSKCGGNVCPSTKRVYNVYYFTVEYTKPVKSTPSMTSSSTATTKSASESVKSNKYKYCHPSCPSFKGSELPMVCGKSTCTIKTDDKSANDKLCHDLVCPNIDETQKASPADSDVVLTFDDIHNPCCVKTCEMAEKVKDFIVEGFENKNKKTTNKDDPCYCDCECNFHFTRKTTYCAVCGGYETIGDDMQDQPMYAKPHPCPVYHKMYDKNKIIVQSPWKVEEEKQEDKLDTVSKKTAKQVQKEISAEKRTNMSQKDLSAKSFIKNDKKINKEKKAREKKAEQPVFDDPLGQAPALEQKKPIPKYTIPFVPKNMGWLWTAEDIPGLNFRPKWKPGAAHKLLVRRYKAMQGNIDIIAKKKRAMLQKRKKYEMKPTLIVKKTDGEYSVQMEVFKKYSNDRLLFQYPYDDKPPQFYTTGKTQDERDKVAKKRERRERRETRRKCRLLQSSFRDRCQEICVKAYDQAIGVLPLPNPNDPSCPCDVDATHEEPPQIDSCSCSDEGDISSSDTDGDDWIVEFTPPAARWDPKAKHLPIAADNESQYNYLDYKVKLVDKSGNPVPRYFKGTDGKQECSDLGGFWGPGHVWQEINKDGYIGADKRWIPMNFTGPDGMYYSAEEGFFTDSSGQCLRLGIDGYIDKDNKWVYYPKGRDGKLKSSPSSATTATKGDKKAVKGKIAEIKTIKETPKKSNKELNVKLKLTKPSHNKPIEKTKISKEPPHKVKSPVVMSLSVCNHSKILPKYPVVPPYRHENQRRTERYRDIWDDYDISDSIPEFRTMMKTSRASNTPRKRLTPFTIITQ